MDIDFYISNISDDKIIGSGFEKKCYDFGDVVLLESRFLTKNKLDDEVKKISYVKDVLNKINVNAYKVYGYKIFNDKLYILENKVKGSSLQGGEADSNIDKYINRLNELNNYLFLKEFVVDSLSILNNGLSIDFGRPNNFLFDGDGIKFIDLSVADNPFDMKYLCFYLFYDIIYNHCDIRSHEDYDIISSYYHSIYDKLCSIFIELGYDKNMYSLSPNGDILSFIDRKLDRFLNDFNRETKTY